MLSIIDNFLSDDELNALDTLLSLEFPWHYADHKSNVGDNQFQFVHVFFDNSTIKSDYIKLLNPFFDKITMYAIRRIKANITTKATNIEQYEMHRDYPDGLEALKTGIFYLNDNNGKTVFEDGKEIQSVRNRMITFPAHLKHSGTTHTDTNIRCVINFNWY